MSKNELLNQEDITLLSELKSTYSCFDDKEEPYYHALSKAIMALRAEGDLISREELKKAITEATYNFEQIPIRVDKVQEIIDTAPAVPNEYMRGYEAAEREYKRPQGEWLFHRCSLCGRYDARDNENFCPNCGADMRKGGADMRKGGAE